VSSALEVDLSRDCQDAKRAEQCNHYPLVSGIGEIIAIGNAAHQQRLDEWARLRRNVSTDTKGKCFLVLALIGLLLGSALLGHKAAFGFFFQRADELLEAQQAAAIGTTANGCQS
jgi:hypothetical protein